MWKPIEFDEQHLKLLLEMIKNNYGNIEIANEEFLLHEYFENPSGKAIVLLAVNESNHKDIIGQQAFWTMTYRIRDKEYICGNSLNSLVKSEFRGQGIFYSLASEGLEMISKKMKFCYGMPNPNSYHSFTSNLGFSDIGRINLFLKPIDIPELVYSKTNSNILKTIVRPFNLLFNRGKYEIPSGFEIVKISSENIGLVDELWEKIKNKYLIMNKRESKYIKFRYLDMPLRKYNVYVLKENGEARGLVVGRVTTVADMKCGMIVDLIYSSGNKLYGDLLIKHIQNAFLKDGATLLGCLMLENTEEAKAIKHNRLFKCPQFLEPQPFRLVIKSFDEEVDNNGIYDIKNWFFTMGDYDVI